MASLYLTAGLRWVSKQTGVDGSPTQTYIDDHTITASSHVEAWEKWSLSVGPLENKKKLQVTAKNARGFWSFFDFYSRRKTCSLESERLDQAHVVDFVSSQASCLSFFTITLGFSLSVRFPMVGWVYNV